MPRILRQFFLSATLLFLMTYSVSAHHDSDAKPPASPPKAKVSVVTDVMHGKAIADPYRWLEDGNSAETQQYVKDQLEYTRQILSTKPQYARIRARLDALLKIGSVGSPRVAKGLYFYTRREGGQNQPILYVREGVNGTDRVLLNVNTMSADGTVALDWWYNSDEGKYVVFGTSPGGSEISTLRVIEVATGKLLEEKIDRTRAASIAWLPDSSGFYYTRYPRPGDVPSGQEMYNRRVYFHKLGVNLDGLKDELIFGDGRSPQEWPGVDISEDGRWLLVSAAVTFDRSDLFIKDLKSGGPLKPVVTGRDFSYGADFFGDHLYIVTNEGAPRFRVFKVAAAEPEREKWREIIPETDSVLQGFRFVDGKILARYEKNASSKLKTYDTDGRFLTNVTLPGIGTVLGLSGEKHGKTAFFGFHSFTTPQTIYSLNMENGDSAEWAKITAPIDPNAYEVKQVFYPSSGAVTVPMFIVSKKGIKLNGKNPTLLAGYGGFNVSRTPAFAGWIHLWLEAGGIYADANLRGGSEYGEEWHKAGMLDKKQNVFDDFIAAAEYLIREKYTDKDHIAVYGRSNGGLLTGAVLTQRPELFQAAIVGVPLLDMLRYQHFQIARLWIPEYGSADDPKQFGFLHAYSPYHQVKDRTTYPATLIFTSDGDTRVDPLHARKMTARLQAAAKNGPAHPILLRIEPKAGHGAGKPVSKQIDEWADIFTFLFWQLGVQ